MLVPWFGIFGYRRYFATGQSNETGFSLDIFDLDSRIALPNRFTCPLHSFNQHQPFTLAYAIFCSLSACVIAFYCTNKVVLHAGSMLGMLFAFCIWWNAAAYLLFSPCWDIHDLLGFFS